MHEFKGYMERVAFKSFVGTALQCRGCSDVLDCRRSVEVDLSDGAILILCGDCADYLQVRLMVAHEPTTLFTTTVVAPTIVDLYDGRMMLADAPKKPRRKRNPYKRGAMWRAHDALLARV